VGNAIPIKLPSQCKTCSPRPFLKLSGEVGDQGCDLAFRPLCSVLCSPFTCTLCFPNKLKRTTEAEFFDKIQREVLRVFLLAIQSPFYSFALRFLYLQTHATSYNFCSVLLYTVKEKGGNLIENYTPFQEIHTETSSLRTLKIMPRNLVQLHSPTGFGHSLHTQRAACCYTLT
jgi:hypothetical protein